MKHPIQNFEDMEVHSYMLKEFKFINLANVQFDRLKLFIDKCDPQTSEIATSAGRFIESALYTHEINETEI